MNYQDLEIIGLNETEAKIYFAILELGEAIVSRIAQRADIKRTTVYLSLANLKAKGLIGQAKKYGQMRYFAEDPKNLPKIMEERKNKLAELMPEILSIANLVDQKPMVRYFEGRIAPQKIYDDILDYKSQELLVWLPDDMRLLDNKYFAEEFTPKRVAKKIKIKAITSGTLTNTKAALNSPKKLCQIKFVPDSSYFSKVELFIYGKNKIGIISSSEKLSIIIESKNIHEILKSIFNVMWEKF